MSLHQFFLDDQVLSAETGGEAFALRLSADDARHARVLRLAPGEHIGVIDAAQDYFECEIVCADDDLPLVRVARRKDATDDEPCVVLVQGMAKGDKMDAVVRHATEVGVSGFMPVLCERSVVKLDAKKTAARTERWRSIAKSAAMQAGRRLIPEVAEPCSIAEAAPLVSQATAVLVCWEDAPQTASIRTALSRALAETGCTVPSDARIAVVVGPEGGLSEREVQTLLASNPRSSLVSLGPSILRTETAGVVGPALVLHELRERETVDIARYERGVR